MSQRRSFAAGAPVALALALGSCQKATPPRELSLELPELISSKDPTKIIAVATGQDGTREKLSGEQPFSLTPPDLATISKDGSLVCNKSGEGKVSLNVAGVVGDAKLACMLAARIDAPAKLRLDAAQGEVDPNVKVLDSAGKVLALPLSLSSDNGAVVQARNGRLLPGSVGLAKLTLRAGQVVSKLDVEVVRTVKPEVLPVDQNRRIFYSLEPGKYELSLALKQPHRISVEWLGAPYCAYKAEGAEHTVACTLQSKGGVSFDNPAFLRDGTKTPSIEGVVLREVP